LPRLNWPSTARRKCPWLKQSPQLSVRRLASAAKPSPSRKAGSRTLSRRTGRFAGCPSQTSEPRFDVAGMALQQAAGSRPVGRAMNRTPFGPCPDRSLQRPSKLPRPRLSPGRSHQPLRAVGIGELHHRLANDVKYSNTNPKLRLGACQGSYRLFAYRTSGIASDPSALRAKTTGRPLPKAGARRSCGMKTS